MNAALALSLALDPSRLFRALGRAADPWQRDLLLCRDRQILLNASRQSGKSTVVSALALHTVLFAPGGLVLILSPSQRQSAETFRKVLDAYRALGRPLPAVHETQLRLELANRARVLCLPGREETVRSFGGVSLLVLDEAARIRDDLYRAVRPMLAVSGGRLVALSTPFGQRGWFWREWQGDGPWRRYLVPWRDCPRIRPAFIDEERRALGQAWVDQEYECLFVTMHGLVYPDFSRAAVDDGPEPSGRPVGGIDFGWRNPFAAVWGVLGRDDVLWLEGERYLSATPLHEHAAALKRLGPVQWYADPAGRTEIEELRAAGLSVRAGDNALRPGIAAVAARLNTGRLRVRRRACPNLLAEAALYRYPAGDAARGEEPLDRDNHALAALRYLVSRLDARFLARLRRPGPDPNEPSPEPAGGPSALAGRRSPLDPDALMLHHLADLLFRLGQWLRPKAMPPALAAPPPAPGFLDAYRRQRPPTPSELLAELKGAAWACASINASVCASFPPKLYVATRPGQPTPRCLTRALPPVVAKRLRSTAHLEPYTRAADHLEEVAEHPLLSLLQQVNPAINSFDLWELTTLYQEVHGVAYWYLEPGPLGPPRGVWLLPSQHVTPYRNPESNNLVDYYLYRSGRREQRFRPDDLIVFRYPDPRDPYSSGLSPLRACYEQVCLTSDFAAFKKAKFDNHAVPDAIVSPEEVIGEEERDRLETQWNQRFRRGGAGRVVVAESALRVQLLAHSLGDLAALADQRATKEEIANSFHVPLAFLTSETNLANLQAAEHQHMAKAITPRLRRRDEKLNERLVPLFDPSGRLFLASEDPVPVNRELSAREQQLNLQYGVVTINEVRGEQGLPPVPWGDAPWLPVRWAQTNRERPGG